MRSIALDSHVKRPVPLEIVPALRLLLRIYDHAEDAEVEPWQFAVEFPDLKPAGLTRGDLRWLISKGYIEYARETTIPGDRARSFRLLPATAIRDDACITLTDAGARHFRRVLANVPSAALSSRPALVTEISEEFSPPVSTASHPDLALPEWDENRRELRYRGKLVKRYRVTERALRESPEKLALAFYQLPVAPYAPVRRQLLLLLRAVNRLRKVAGKKPIPTEILPLRRRVVKPFGDNRGCR